MFDHLPDKSAVALRGDTCACACLLACSVSTMQSAQSAGLTQFGTLARALQWSFSSEVQNLTECGRSAALYTSAGHMCMNARCLTVETVCLCVSVLCCAADMVAQLLGPHAVCGGMLWQLGVAGRNVSV